MIYLYSNKNNCRTLVSVNTACEPYINNKIITFSVYGLQLINDFTKPVLISAHIGELNINDNPPRMVSL